MMGRVTLCVFLLLCSAPVARAQSDKERKDSLFTLYLLSVAADRCGFAMTARQAETLDRNAKSLAESLKLSARQNDAVYSEADVAFENQGPKACDRNSDFAKSYRDILKKMTGS